MPEISEPMDSTESKTTDKKEYPETIFKSSYHLGEHLLQLFVNHRAVSKSFSFIIRKGKWNTIYNLTADEKLSFVKKLFSQLTLEEQKVVLDSSESKRA